MWGALLSDLGMVVVPATVSQGGGSSAVREWGLGADHKLEGPVAFRLVPLILLCHCIEELPSHIDLTNGHAESE